MGALSIRYERAGEVGQQLLSPHHLGTRPENKKKRQQKKEKKNFKTPKKKKKRHLPKVHDLS
jgi:hypothetical protein